MIPKVFIDGRTGTTGLRVHEWMAGREDVEILALPLELRRSPEDRHRRILESDVTILCLPDEASQEVAEWVRESNTRLIDTSTAHRVAEGWVYGLPEMVPGQRQAIRQAKNVSNPGCYPTGFILLVRPLVDAGLLVRDAPISINGLSGYSGGGNSMIAKWENPETGLSRLPYEAPYALGRRHKHIPEMRKFSGINVEPQFVPSVGSFRCGMRVQVPLHASMLTPGTTGEAVWEVLKDRYKGEEYVEVVYLSGSETLDERSFDPQIFNGSNRVQLHVVSHSSGHVLLIALLDNLGKGASGSSIQNLNLMLGFAEGAGLPSEP